MVKLQTSDIRITYECIRVGYGDIGVCTSDMYVIPVLGYLPKLKRGLELAFGAHFLHGFSMQMFFI